MLRKQHIYWLIFKYMWWYRVGRALLPAIRRISLCRRAGSLSVAVFSTFLQLDVSKLVGYTEGTCRLSRCDPGEKRKESPPVTFTAPQSDSRHDPEKYDVLQSGGPALPCVSNYELEKFFFPFVLALTAGTECWRSYVPTPRAHAPSRGYTHEDKDLADAHCGW